MSLKSMKPTISQRALRLQGAHKALCPVVTRPTSWAFSGLQDSQEEPVKCLTSVSGLAK